jgi:hypothetical protein
MNSKLISSALIAAAGLVSMSAFAAGADNPLEPTRTFMSTQSRSDVRMQAVSQQQGPVTSSNQVDGGSVNWVPLASQRSRSEVRAEGAQRSNSPMFNAAPGRA